MPRLLTLACLCLLTPPLAAQAPPALIELVPEEFGLCLTVRDLRGQHERLSKSDWWQRFRATAVGRAVLESPEVRKLMRLERELAKVFEADWATLRDEVLGDEVLLAYRPAPPGARDEEHGIILLRARQADVLARLIDRLNDVQRRSGELRDLETLTYRGATYHRRNDRGKALYYLLDGPLLAVAAKESTLRTVIERRAAPAPSVWPGRFRRAGADGAFVTLCVNPRGLPLDPGHRDGAVAGTWAALEAIFLTVPAGAPELRLTVQADVERLPPRVRASFVERPVRSALWQYFPAEALGTVAARTNFADLLAALIELTPPAQRPPLTEAAQRSLGAVTGLDFFADILPHVGPDWGVCLLPPPDARQLPWLLAALAVRPGDKPVAVDQALYKTCQLVAGLVVLDYNKNHPDALRLQTALQDKVEVRYLQGDKLFPPGFQPAYALKDGYLVFASCPEAVLAFRPAGTAAPGDEVPLLRVSPRGLGRLLRQRQEQIAAKLARKQQRPAAEARQNLEGLAEFLELFDRVTLSRRAGTGQAEWVLRVEPAD